jgi:hypothetical protein
VTVPLPPFPPALATTCRRCAGPVVWAITDANGQRMPLDPEPDEAGNQAVRRDEHGTVRTRQLRDGVEPEPWERRMVPHFPECERRRAERAERRSDRTLPAASLPPGVIDLAAARRRRRRR